MARGVIITGALALAVSGVAAWAMSAGSSAPAAGAVRGGGRASVGPADSVGGLDAAAPLTPTGLDCDGPDRVVARVGGRPVAARALCAALRRAAGPGAERDPRLISERGPEILARLVEGEVVAQALGAKGAPVTDAEVEAALTELTRGRTGLEAQLRSEGLTLDDLRVDLRLRLARQRATALLGSVVVDEAAIAAEYERDPTRWGTVAKARLEAYVSRVARPSEDAAAEAAMRSVAARLASGLMVDAERLPVFELERHGLDPELERAAFAPELGLGAWSGPVRSTVGWVVFKLLDRIEGRAPSLAEVRGLVERAARARALAAAEARLVAELVARAEVEVDVTW